MPKKGNYEDLTGRVFSQLTVLGFNGRRSFGKSRYGKIIWKCVCSCGKEVLATRSTLVLGSTKSCGCLKGRMCGQWAKERLTVHGKKGTPEWVAWLEMRRRCRSPETRVAHKDYVKRGITFCDRWDSFLNFLEDMGCKPSPNHSLGRIDNNKGYSPDNCRWETKTEQSRNRSNTRFLTIDGVRKPVAQWAEETGVAYSTLLKKSKREHL